MRYQAAIDAMFAIIKDFADDESLSVEWPDVPFDKPDSAGYLRVTVRHATGKQAALCTSGAGERLWENAGVGGVAIFSPIASGNAVGYTLAESLVGALRANTSAVWLRNIRIRELGSEGGYTQVSVTWDFEYRDQQ